MVRILNGARHDTPSYRISVSWRAPIIFRRPAIAMIGPANVAYADIVRDLHDYDPQPAIRLHLSGAGM